MSAARIILTLASVNLMILDLLVFIESEMLRQ